MIFKYSKILILTFIAFLSMLQTAHAKEKPIFDILFIGNSYTYAPDIPKIVETLINTNPNSPIKVNIQSNVAPGLHMKDQWERNAPLEKIRSQKWHYVVLQNQSNWACYPQMRRDFLKYGLMFANEIRSSGGIPVVPETWPKEPGTHWYEDLSHIKNFSYMYARLRKHTPEVAHHLNGEWVPINRYWFESMKQIPNMNLYSDGSHMSLAGAYLVSLVYYKFFTQQNYSNPKSILSGVSDAQAQRIQKIVALDLK